MIFKRLRDFCNQLRLLYTLLKNFVTGESRGEFLQNSVVKPSLNRLKL